MRKVAIISIDSFTITCPVCGYPQIHPKTGSEMWLPEDAALLFKNGKLRCGACNAAIKIPKPYRQEEQNAATKN